MKSIHIHKVLWLNYVSKLQENSVQHVRLLKLTANSCWVCWWATKNKTPKPRAINSALPLESVVYLHK